MYADAVKKLPLAKNGRVNPLETSRLKAELHLHFWQPIVEMLDPGDRGPDEGAAAQDFYSRSRIVRPDEIEQSHRLMKEYLGVARLSFNGWFRLQPLFRSLLAEALSHDNADLVVCAMREFVRLEFGCAIDPGYGHIDSETVAEDQLNDEYWCPEDEIWIAIAAAENGYTHWGIHENNLFAWADAWQARFDDPATLEQTFPGMAKRRSNMARALKPIFDRDWVCDAMLLDDAVRYAKALLEIAFDETRLPSRTASDPGLVEAA